MSVSATPSRIAYAGNGVTTVFNFPYYFQSQPDLKVALFVVATGAITPLTRNVDFTIAGAVTAGFGYLTGANVNIPGATTNVPAVVPAGTSVVMYRDPPLLQNLELPLNSAYVPEPIEAEFDAETLMLQRLSDLLSRAMRLPDGMSATFDTTLPSTMALVASQNCVIAINATGDGFVVGPSLTGIDTIVADAEAAAAAAAASEAAAAASEATAVAAAAAAAQSATDAAAFVNDFHEEDTSAGDIPVSLPLASAGIRLISYINKPGSAFSILVSPTGGDTIHGDPGDTLDAGEVGQYWSNGVDTWYRVN